MKRTMGYGWRINNESLRKAFLMHANYPGEYKTFKAAKKQFKKDADRGYLGKIRKVQFFKITVEVEKEGRK